MNFISAYFTTPFMHACMHACMHANDEFVTVIRSIADTIGAGKESQHGVALFLGPFLAQLALHPHLSGLAVPERLAANDTWLFLLIAALR